MLPAGHVGSATGQILTPTALTEVKDVLPEETMAISGAMSGRTPATSAYNGPTITGIWTSVPEQHTSMTTALKHLEPHEMPSTTLMLGSLAVAPAMQTIIVDCVPIVDPQLAAIIRDNAETVMASPEDSQSACPTHSEVILLRKTWPLATCVAIVHHLTKHFVITLT